MVIVADQVKNSMDHVTDQFALPGRPKSPGLNFGLIQADQDFATEQVLLTGLAVIEAENIGRTLMPKESFVETGHFPSGNDVDPEFAWPRFEQPAR